MKIAVIGERIRMRTWKKGAFAVSLLALASGMGTLLRPAPGVGPTPRVSARTPPSAVSPTHVQPADRRVLNASFGHLPMRFESNVGQSDARVKFLSRGPGSTLFLTRDEAVLSLQANSSAAAQRGEGNLAARRAVLRMALLGANKNPEIAGENSLPGRSNYFIGNDPSRWHAGVPGYARVAYRGVYPGVDEVFYGNHRQFEYDFVVASGADPARIAMQISGASRITPEPDGSLKLAVSDGSMEMRAPLIYQQSGGARKLIGGHYVVTNAKQIRFRVDAYDRSQPLVIDPTLIYSTFLGGSEEDQGLAGVVDPAGDFYATGFTVSTDFPLANAIVSTNLGAANGNSNVFISELAAAGNNLVFSTYLGGTGSPINDEGGNMTGDEGLGIALDATNDVYVAGQTFSTDFPLTSNAYQTINGGGLIGAQTGFLSVLNPQGSGLLYSTYLGGSNGDTVFGVAAAVENGQTFAYVGGATSSSNFPTTANAPQPTYVSSTFEGFLSKLNVFPTNSTNLVFSTYIGGTGNSSAGDGDEVFGVTTDGLGNAYAAGHTSSSDLPVTPGVFQPTLVSGATYNAFAAKVNTTSAPGYTYLTYLGGSGNSNGAGDQADHVAIDSSGNAFLAGDTFSSNFPVKNAYQSVNNGANNKVSNVFVTELNPTATALVYSTYLGGSGNTNVNVFAAGDIAFGIALDSADDAYITGQTYSSNFPTADPIQAANNAYSNNQSNAFVSELSTGGDLLVFSTYLGGSGGGSNSANNGDTGWGIALDSNNAIYVDGTTGSSNFPIANALQAGIGGLDDAFLTKISPQSGTGTISVSPVSLSIYSSAVGTSATSGPATLTNGSSAAITISSIAITGTNKADFSFASSNTCAAGTMVASSNGTCVIAVNYLPSTGNAESAQVSIAFNSPQSPLVVTLFGAIGNFSVVANPGAITVTPGENITSTITAQPAPQGFSGTVALACTGAPSGGTCTISPGSVTVTGTTPQTATLTVNTTAPGLAPPWPGSGSRPFVPAPLRPVFFGTLGVLLGLGLAAFRWRPRFVPADSRIAGALALLAVILLIGVMTACGGSSTTGGTPTGTYTLTITGTSGNLAPTTAITLVVD